MKTLLTLAFLFISTVLNAQGLPAPSYGPYPTWTWQGENCSISAYSSIGTCLTSEQVSYHWADRHGVNWTSPTTCNGPLGCEVGWNVALATTCEAQNGGYLPFCLMWTQGLYSCQALGSGFASCGNCAYWGPSYGNNPVIASATHQYSNISYTEYYLLLQIPNDPNLVGVHFDYQWARIDPTDGLIYLSRGLMLDVIPTI